MSFCPKCGHECEDGTRYCPQCGSELFVSNPITNNNTNNVSTSKKKGMNTVECVAFIFMILSCVAVCYLIFPLIWMIPMTYHYYKSCYNGEKCSISFKILSLIFVSFIGGILMLCDSQN